MPKSPLLRSALRSNVSSCKIYITISAEGPRRRSPAKGGTETGKEEKKKGGSKRGDFRTFHHRMEGLLGMRCGGGGAMWRWGQTATILLFNPVIYSSAATGDLVSYSIKNKEQRCRTSLPYLGRADIIQLKLWHGVDDYWRNTVSD